MIILLVKLKTSFQNQFSRRTRVASLLGTAVREKIGQQSRFLLKNTGWKSKLAITSKRLILPILNQMSVSWDSKEILQMLTIFWLETIFSEATTWSTMTKIQELVLLLIPPRWKVTLNNQQYQIKHSLRISGNLVHWTRLRKLLCILLWDYRLATLSTNTSPKFCNGYMKNWTLNRYLRILYFFFDQFKFNEGTVINESSLRSIFAFKVALRVCSRLSNSLLCNRGMLTLLRLSKALVMPTSSYEI